MTSPHPNDLALERHRLTPSPELAEHLAGCESCRARLARAEEQETDFRARVFPRTVDRVAGAKPRWFIAGWSLAGALATAALVVVVARLPVTPGPDGLQIKGGLTLTAYRLGSEGQPTVALTGSERASPSDVIGFRVRTSERCALALLSLGEEVTVLIPAQRVMGDQRLEIGASVDGSRDRERFVALCARDEADLREALRRVQASAPAWPELPQGVEHATLDVPVEPRP